MENQKNGKSIKEESDLAALLSFIENNASKENFIAWLNTQEEQSYSDEDTWERIKAELTGSDEVSIASLRTYAKSLTSEQDVEHLLKDVKETTQEAERTAERLSYLTYFKKFSVAVGGASIASGLFFFILAIALAFQFVGGSLSEEIRGVAASAAIFMGVLNVLAGLLLATR